MVEGKDEYEAEAIFDSKYVDGIMLYYVKWVGYSDDECSWEPVEHLTNSADLITEFNRNHPGALRPPLKRPQGSAPMTSP